MLVLGIETSCDETSAALVEDGHRVLANVVSSQIAKHAEYGGVIPELAAREHLRAVEPIAHLALDQAGVELGSVDAVAVTAGPGLLPALLVGISYAKGLATALGKPLIGVDHMAGHIYGGLIDHPELVTDVAAWPMLALIVSGGHSLLVKIEADGACETLGRTLDDAAGEAFDKAARILQLSYPGGPLIDKLAREGNRRAVDFPRGLTGGKGTPLKPENKYNFSFSGLKTALLYHVRRDPSGGDELRDLGEQEFVDIIASYQEAIADVLVRKTCWAAEDCGARNVILCGGVACNSRLRECLGEALGKRSARLLITPPKYCTDNAAMITGLACHQLRQGLVSGLDLDAFPRHPGFTVLPFAPRFRARG